MKASPEFQPILDSSLAETLRLTASSADPQYWSAMWENRTLTYEEYAIPFRDIFDRHVLRGGDCLEVGCYPGGFLIYLSKRFGVTVHGIDSYPGVGAGFAEYLSHSGAAVGKITEGDFFKFTPERQYDVVCSFGFVEHFFDFRGVLAKHAELVKPGGILIVTCPNFRRLQYVLHWMLDRDNLRKHVLPAMDLKAWEATLSGCGMEILERGYSETFLFWTESLSPKALWWAKHITKFASWLNGRVRRPNMFSSPFMYCVARKPDPKKRGGTEPRAQA